MKILKTTSLLFIPICGTSIAVNAQFQGLKDKLKSISVAQVAKALGIDKLLKQPATIKTKFEDVNRLGKMMPDFKATLKAHHLYLLPKCPTGGFILCEGLYEMTNKSYCLVAGKFAPSKGDGYMFEATIGPKEAIVTAILKRAEIHPEVEQHDIQVLLWTIIARTKFADYAGQVKLTAMKLLTLKQLTQLEGGALGILPFNIVEKAKDQLPDGIKAIFEAENNIRQLVASGNYTFADMEKYAMVAGMAPPRSDVPSTIWTKHSDGYYVRYFPSGYCITKVQVYVPKDLIANGNKVVYDATSHIACLANTGSQRLAQTNEPLNPNYKLKLTTICKTN